MFTKLKRDDTIVDGIGIWNKQAMEMLVPNDSNFGCWFWHSNSLSKFQVNFTAEFRMTF